MNKEPLSSDSELSAFFYQNLLLDYAEKKLDPERSKKMKELSKTSEENKEALGAMLLAIEYLDNLKKVSFEASVDFQGEKNWFKGFLYTVLFLVLVLVFSLSGYFLIKAFLY